jgi:hypothetical protein
LWEFGCGDLGVIVAVLFKYYNIYHKLSFNTNKKY